MKAVSDIRYSEPVVNPGKTNKALYPNAKDREHELECISELLHVHVWPDVVGINIAPHGDLLSLGIWNWSDKVPPARRIGPGWFFEYRVRRAIAQMDRHVRRLKDRHASIAATAARVQGIAR